MVWDFKRQEDNSRGSEKNSCLVNKCLLGHLETMGQGEDFDQMGPARFLPDYLVHIKLELSMTVAPFLEQTLYLKFF